MMPSKWDDAQKWIASPTSTRTGQRPKQKWAPRVEEEFDTKRVDESLVRKKNKKMEEEEEEEKDAQTVSAGVCIMKDMGTEMTPLTSQEPSRTGTPARATTPTLCSPGCSPGRGGGTAEAAAAAEGDSDQLTEKQLKLKTRREIMILGTKLGKTNIAAWASKEDDDEDEGDSDRVVDLHVDVPGEKKTAVGVDIRAAAAWEEAEKSKYIARYKREEIKIQAWENHQRAMAEAELKKMEVKVERRRIHGHNKLQSKLADVRHKAMEKHAVAESKRNLQASRVAQKADFMRRTGRTPSSSPTCTCWSFCCR